MEQAIWNNQPAPEELIRYQYRKHFGLSAKQMNEEPAQEFFTNLYIIGEIEKYKEYMRKRSDGIRQK